MENTKLKDILLDLADEIEATLDSHAVSDIRIIERRRMVRCNISLRCKETFNDGKHYESVQVNVPLEFVVNAKETEVSMIIPREPTVNGTYWFNNRKIESNCKTVIKLDKLGKIKGTFEFDMDQFTCERCNQQYVLAHFSISK